MNPDIYKFDPETVTPKLVRILKSATTELETLGVEFFPNVQVWGKDAPNPYHDDLTSGPLFSDLTLSAEDEEGKDARDDKDVDLVRSLNF
jgi:hypothetical protein